MPSPDAANAVSRTVTVTYDAPDDDTAEAFEGVLESLVFGTDVRPEHLHAIYEQSEREDSLRPLRITNQAFSGGPARTIGDVARDIEGSSGGVLNDPAWMASDGHC